MELQELRHTAAHVMAQAVKRLWPGVKLSIGPAIEDGFYYDFDMEHRLSEEDFPRIEEEMRKIVEADYPLERKEVTREEAQEIFKNEPYKLELIEDLPDGTAITTYRQGEFVDLCAGPHVSRTGEVKHYKLLSVAGAYWRGDERRQMLQRLYATAFFTSEELEEYVRLREEAAASDHRRLGKELGLFMLADEAPGEPFLLPRGVVVFGELIKWWRAVHHSYGYEEIRTPIMLKRYLWERSGHWEHYSQGMYALKVDDEDYAIKPMNCPGSILVFRSLGAVSLMDKAVKLAELGLVHRAERSGQLHGLMRVREFTQDDAHIYCTPENLQSEIAEILEIMDKMYSTLGLTYDLELSTRPEDRIGEDSVWDMAEDALKEALKGREYKINAGDGAFYGPKIDVHVKDRMRRSWQCGTIQVDFNLPERFDLTYVESGGGRKRPIMLHRVIYGSIERFFGILIEHFKGAFPVWLAPEQVRIIPIVDKFEAFAQTLAVKLRESDIRVDVDGRSETLNKRIKLAALAKVPYTVVVGEKEQNSGLLQIRKFGGKSFELPVEVFVSMLKNKIKNKDLDY